MFSRWFRSWAPRYLRPVVRGMQRAGLTPNGMSLANLALSTLTGALIAFGRLWWAGAALLVAGVMDGLDGQLARETGQASAFGGFLDSISDHYGDFAILMGTAYWGYTIQERAVILLAIAALFGSVAGSHIRAKAENLGIFTQSVGSFTRFERIILLLVGLLSGWMLPALALLAVGTHLSALQRLYFVLKTIRSQASGRQAPDILP